MTRKRERRRPIAFRLLESELNLLDALAKHFTEAGPGGVEYNRADVIRLAIRRLAAEYLPQQKSRPN